jgi:hypothetical protein
MDRVGQWPDNRLIVHVLACMNKEGLNVLVAGTKTSTEGASLCQPRPSAWVPVTQILRAEGPIDFLNSKLFRLMTEGIQLTDSFESS